MHIARAQPEQQNQQAQNPARDLARILLPLGGHLWLLIRLFGFVYFFTAGGGYRRAILLGICAFIVFIANTGAFRPLFRTLWEPVRRHVEGLVPLAARPEDQQQRQRRPRRREQGPQELLYDAPAAAAANNNNQNNQNNQNNNDRATPTRNDRRQPSPTDLADRLLRERHEQSLLRRAERAVALFLASLIPGVGERHIAARDAAEARRLALAEEQERERREQRERDEQEEKEMEVQEEERVRRESLVAPAPAQSSEPAESSGRDVTGSEGHGVRERAEQGRRPSGEA